MTSFPKERSVKNIVDIYPGLSANTFLWNTVEETSRLNFIVPCEPEQ